MMELNTFLEFSGIGSTSKVAKIAIDLQPGHRSGADQVVMTFCGGIKRSQAWFKGNQLHHESGPARTTYGSHHLKREEWFCDGHRFRGWYPSDITYHPNHLPRLCLWHEDLKHPGTFCRRGGQPNLVEYSLAGSVIREEWRLPSGFGLAPRPDDRPNIRLYRDDDGSLQAEEWRDQHRYWHRVQEPAVIHYFPSGAKQAEWWYLHGVFQKSSFYDCTGEEILFNPEIHDDLRFGDGELESEG